MNKLTSLFKQRRNKVVILLTLSGLIFSLGIPLIQKKIDKIKEDSDTVTGNLNLSQVDRVLMKNSIDSLDTIQFLEDPRVVKDKDLREVLNKIEGIYRNEAQESMLYFYLLQSDAPESNDPKVIGAKAKEYWNQLRNAPDILERETKSNIKKFQDEFDSKLNFWMNWRGVAYATAVILQLLGVWLGLFVKEEPNQELLDEIRGVRGQLDRLTHLSRRNE